MLRLHSASYHSVLLQKAELDVSSDEEHATGQSTNHLQCKVVFMSCLCRSCRRSLQASLLQGIGVRVLRISKAHEEAGGDEV